ncbi:hypothetical protein OSH10_16795 [Kaistia defluvii]|uniref:hypothetical protein n=1 Tax=Kaistia defluvii TaxID=410841 RepID=UPI002255D5ED|nr:hypothetical protein [Kaistia defluvii]MCX5520101.1 hypothetical protein [Kaistia defluvii]
MAVLSGGKRVGVQLGAALALMAATSVAEAQPAPPSLSIELNGAEANAKACRLSFVIDNRLSTGIDDMALELVLFEQDGRVNRFVVVRTAKVPAGKSRVRQFDIPETSCPSIARILVNDVKECSGAGLTPGSCAESIQVATRTDMRFDN